MKSMMKRFLIAGLAFATVAGTLVPAQAMPISVPKAIADAQASDVVNVQYYYDGWRRGPPPRYERDRYYSDRYYRDRDYRDERRERRDRRTKDVLIPLGALAAGAILGGALAQQPRETYRPVPEYRHNPEFAPRAAPRYRPAPAYGARQGQAHVNWCANRYRSYDYRSNTFQPYNGPRQTCYSPYS